MITLTPTRWMKETGIEILDPDGWNRQDSMDWERPITLDVFMEKASHSTTRGGYPKYPMHIWKQQILTRLETEMATGTKLLDVVERYSSTRPKDDFTAPLRVVLHRSNGPAGEWVTHIQNMDNKGMSYGHYFRDGEEQKAYKEAYDDYILRCSKYGVTP